MLFEMKAKPKSGLYKDNADIQKKIGKFQNTEKQEKKMHFFSSFWWEKGVQNKIFILGIKSSRNAHLSFI